jgi:hypothetical protein
LGLLLLVLDVVASLAAAGAVTLAGLRTLRGEQVRGVALVLEGLKRAWLTFKVLFLAMWWITLVSVVVAFLVRPSAFRMGPAGRVPAVAEARFWLLGAATWVAYSVAMMRCYPALPIALSRPELGAREALRSALGITKGARRRLFGIAVLFQCLTIPSLLLYHWAWRMPAGDEKALVLAVHGAYSALLMTFTGLGAPVIHHELLEMGRDTYEAELGRVFE